MTNDLYRRVREHRDGTGGRFTARYGVTKLVWFQDFQSVEDAIEREKSFKRWLRRWKVELIETSNPDWHDLYPRWRSTSPKGRYPRPAEVWVLGSAPSGSRPPACPRMTVVCVANDEPRWEGAAKVARGSIALPRH